LISLVALSESKECQESIENSSALVVATENDNDVEVQERGVVKFDVYKLYWKAMGIFLSPAILLSLTLMQGSKNFTDIWFDSKLRLTL